MRKAHLNYLKNDIINYMKYKKDAPFSCERIFVSPSEIKFMLNPSQNAKYMFSRVNTGNIIGGNWDLNIVSMTELAKYKVCYSHFSESKSWEDSNAYDLMLSIIEKTPGADNCYNLEDIIQRYTHLDEIYVFAKEERKLLNANEVNNKGFREEGGIYVHVGRYGDLIFGLGGCHRLSIAKILELDQIPVQLGVVHKSAISYWNKQAKITRTLPSFKDYLVKIFH